MNRISKICVAALAAGVAFSASAKLKPGEESVGWSPIIIGIATPVQMPWDFNWDVFGLDVNVAYADANKVGGLEVALGGSVARTYMVGAQVAGLCSYADCNAYGLQVAVCDLCFQDFYGLQASAFTYSRSMYGLQANLLGAIAQDDVYGLRVSGLGSLNDGTTHGVEIAGLANITREVEGVQLALGYNHAEKLHGCQVALVNYARTSSTSAFQIGLVNIIRDNVVPVLPLVNGCFFEADEN